MNCLFLLFLRVNVPLVGWNRVGPDGVHSEGGLEVSGRISSSAASPVPQPIFALTYSVCAADYTGKRVTIVTNFGWDSQVESCRRFNRNGGQKALKLDQEVVQVGVQKRCSPESPPCRDEQERNEALLEAKLAGAGALKYRRKNETRQVKIVYLALKNFQVN